MAVPPEYYPELLPETPGEGNGLKTSRISDGPGTMKQDLEICCEIHLTQDISKYLSEGSPSRETSGNQAVRVRTPVMSNCLPLHRQLSQRWINAKLIIKNIM